jgi:hypothetical protein
MIVNVIPTEKREKKTIFPNLKSKNYEISFINPPH